MSAILHGVRSLPLTTTLRGRLYESTAKTVLESKYPGLILCSVGRAGDRGVDLLGEFKDIEFLVQCKSSPSKAPGGLWRELIGACDPMYNSHDGTRLIQHPEMKTTYNNRVSKSGDQNTKKMLALLVSPLPMTSQAHAEFSSSKIPLIHCILPLSKVRLKEDGELEASAGKIRSIIANSMAEKILKMIEKS
ncbi:hypothetical protein DASB73_021100 [Starmerella bacillaris]|uniref:Required for respiratory growth protein 7, mitochondrial n=1 Tax=Starmerella bacillaris TaxID=1247836 RepID=A0AAV5RIW8_STABA|nr:hypothetical protein DASB73_021100 [Starmerella bacillaris]